MKDQKLEELEVFRGFAAICPLSIEPGSIEAVDPPAPDIRCRQRNGQCQAFELVEILDNPRTQRKIGMLNGVDHLQRLASSYSDNSTLRRDYGNARLSVNYAGHSSRHERKKANVVLLRHLDNTAPNVVGGKEFISLPPTRELSCIQSVRIDRGYLRLSFTAWAGGESQVSAQETMRAKFSRSYKCDVRIELIAYLNSQPQGPLDWLEPLGTFVAENRSTSPFDKVWIYDHRQNRGVLHAWPETEPPN